MTNWSQFAWLSHQAADGLLVGWPITAALSFLFVVGLFAYLRRSSPKFTGGWLLQMTPLLVPMAILMLGSVYSCCSPVSAGQRVSHRGVGYVILALVILQLQATAFLISVAKGARLAVSALQGMFLFCTFWSSFVATMSISGDWL